MSETQETASDREPRLKADDHCCEDASALSTTHYIPCNRPAVFIVYSERDKRDYRMCQLCAQHSIQNRDMQVKETYKGAPNHA